MKINNRGATRVVFLFKKFVIKVPSYRYSWENFLKGIIANIGEDKCWRYNSGKYETGKSYLLCPVIWTSFGGFILIMKRADTEKWHKEVALKFPAPDDFSMRQKYHENLYKKWIDAGFGGDDKCDNYGYINGQLVKIDY